MPTPPPEVRGDDWSRGDDRSRGGGDWSVGEDWPRGGSPGGDDPVGDRGGRRAGRRGHEPAHDLHSDTGAHAGNRPQPGPDLGVDLHAADQPEPSLPEPALPEPSLPDEEPRPIEPRPLPVAPERPMLSLGMAGLCALLGLAMVVGAQLTHQAYALVVLGVQVLFVVAWTVASQPPAPRVVAAVGLAVAAGADAAAVLVNPASLAPLAYLTVAGFVVGVLGQLVRPAGRVRVTESLGSSLVVVLGVVAFATLVVLSRKPLGTQVIVACVIGAAAALVTAHLIDTLAPIPRLAPPVPRGGIGVVVGAMVGTAMAGLAGGYLEGLTTLPTAVAGLAAAVIALMVDLSANYAEVSRQLAGATPAWWLVRHMQGPLTAFALAAPTAYAASLVLA